MDNQRPDPIISRRSNFQVMWAYALKELTGKWQVGNNERGYIPLTFIEAVHLRLTIKRCMTESLDTLHEIRKGNLKGWNDFWPHSEAISRWMWELYGFERRLNPTPQEVEEFNLLRILAHYP